MSTNTEKSKVQSPKSINKAGLLILTLALPALLMLMLHGFAENHYTLPHFVPQTDSTGNVLMNGKDTVFHSIPPFSLIDQNGKKVTEQLTKGKIYVVDFVFTRCNTICPKVATNLLQIQNEFADDGVLLLSHSIDPIYDTPQVLNEFAKKHEAKNGVWYFLTGDKKQLYDLSTKGYFLSAVENDSKETDPNLYISHSDKIVLIDKDGHIRGFYSGTDDEEIERLKAEIKILIDIYEKK